MWKKNLILIRILGVSLIIIFVDQITKFWVFKTHSNVQIIGDFLRITIVQNHYGLFGLHYRIPFLQITALAICAIFIILYKAKLLSLSLILGGAISNFVDRVRIGAVIDWIDIGVKNIRWPVFNIADASITIGIFWLILKEIKRK